MFEKASKESRKKIDGEIGYTRRVIEKAAQSKEQPKVNISY